MAFTSITFLFLFLPFFFIIYYIIPFRAKNLAILIFSMVMVVSFDNLSAIVLLFSIAINFNYPYVSRNIRGFWRDLIILLTPPILIDTLRKIRGTY